MTSAIHGKDRRTIFWHPYVQKSCTDYATYRADIIQAWSKLCHLCWLYSRLHASRCCRRSEVVWNILISILLAVRSRSRRLIVRKWMRWWRLLWDFHHLKILVIHWNKHCSREIPWPEQLNNSSQELCGTCVQRSPKTVKSVTWKSKLQPPCVVVVVAASVRSILKVNTFGVTCAWT